MYVDQYTYNWYMKECFIHDGYIVDELVGVGYSGKIRKIYVCSLWFDVTVHPYLGNNINERFDIQRRHQIVLRRQADLLPKAVNLLIYVVADLPSSVPSQQLNLIYNFFPILLSLQMAIGRICLHRKNCPECTGTCIHTY